MVPSSMVLSIRYVRLDSFLFGGGGQNLLTLLKMREQTVVILLMISNYSF